MDYQGDNINRRQEMLSRFRESLSRPLSERFFDEDELIDIFDYAGDVGDDYLRIEALMCASRFYPDSEDLMERKAIFYAQLSEEASNKYIDDNEDSTGLMWDIMRAHRVQPTDDESKIAILDSLIDTYKDLNDEEVIQFIDLVSQYGQIDWLRENMDKLRSKVQYVNILLYEIAVAADNNQDLALSAQMMEELTELEPFNAYFWLMLAKVYASLDQGEKALNAIDYALAINPDDVPSLFTKAKLLYVNERSSDEIIDLLKRILELSPNDVGAVKLLATVYSDTGNKILGSTILSEFIKKYPNEGASIIPDLLFFQPNDIAALLDRFYKANEENAQVMWASWAHQMAESGYSDVANEILEAYHRNSGIKIFALFPIENAFKQKRFGEVLESLYEYLEHNDNAEFDFPTLAVLHLVSIIKIGDFAQAKEFCRFFEKNGDVRRISNISGRLEFIGLHKIIKQIKNRLNKTTDPADWVDYDPLDIWS